MHEDRLRALGWQLDQQHLEEISLTVEDDTYQVIGHRQGTDPPEVITIRFTSDEIETLRTDAQRRRGRGAARSGAARPSRLSALRNRQVGDMSLSQWLEQTQALNYQEILRAIGHEMDHRGVKNFRLDERANALLLRLHSTGPGPDIQEVFPLSRSEVRTRVSSGIERRRVGKQQPPQ